MKIAIDETITLEFDEWILERANAVLADIRVKHPERVDDIFSGVLTLLLFRQIEKSVPGTIHRITASIAATQPQG